MTRVKSVSDNSREAEARRRPELAIRLASAVVLAALAIGAILYQPWTFLILVIVGSLLVAWEWGQLTRGNGFDGTALISGVSVATVAILVFLGRPDLALFVLAAAAVAIGLSVCFDRRQRLAARRSRLRGSAGRGAPVAPRRPPFGAPPPCFIFSPWPGPPTPPLMPPGACIGGPKLAPRISPKKTWSGFIVGTLTPALVGYAFAEVAQGDFGGEACAGERRARARVPNGRFARERA